MPYICKLTFTAPGGDLGDIIQVKEIDLGRKIDQTRLVERFKIISDTGTCLLERTKFRVRTKVPQLFEHRVRYGA